MIEHANDYPSVSHALDSSPDKGRQGEGIKQLYNEETAQIRLTRAVENNFKPGEFKFTENAIVKALECCVDDTDDICQECPLCESCMANMGGAADIKQLALDLIDNLRKRNEMLCFEVKKLRSVIPEKQGVFTVIGNCVVYSKTAEDYDKLIRDLCVHTEMGLAEDIRRAYADFDPVNEIITPETLSKCIYDMIAERNGGKITNATTQDSEAN